MVRPRVQSQQPTARSRILERIIGQRIKLRNKPGPKPMTLEEKAKIADMRKKRMDRRYKKKKTKVYNFEKKKKVVNFLMNKESLKFHNF